MDFLYIISFTTSIYELILWAVEIYFFVNILKVLLSRLIEGHEFLAQMSLYFKGALPALGFDPALLL